MSIEKSAALYPLVQASIGAKDRIHHPRMSACFPCRRVRFAELHLHAIEPALTDLIPYEVTARYDGLVVPISVQRFLVLARLPLLQYRQAPQPLSSLHSA